MNSHRYIAIMSIQWMLNTLRASALAVSPSVFAFRATPRCAGTAAFMHSTLPKWQQDTRKPAAGGVAQAPPAQTLNPKPKQSSDFSFAELADFYKQTPLSELKAHARRMAAESSHNEEEEAEDKVEEIEGDVAFKEREMESIRSSPPPKELVVREVDVPAVSNNQLMNPLDDEVAEYKFEGPKRCGTVAIVGAPNAGKSTLMNHLVGSKVAIVTHKRQTTRNSVTGIGMENGTQIIYIDTPGIMAPRPKQRLNKAMVKAAWNSARDADEIFFLIDADKIIPGGEVFGRKPIKVVHPVSPEWLRLREDSNEHLVMRRLCERRQKFHIILNKVDQIKDERRSLLLPFAEELRKQSVSLETGECMVKKVFAVSAISGKGLDAIKSFVRDVMPLGEWHYPPDQISSQPLRQIVAEITRESILLRSHEEVPYVAFVETDIFQERDDGSVYIEQTVFVETPGQKIILVGMIKDLSTRSRLQMARFLEREVHLKLFIRNKKGWTEDNPIFYKKMGLDFNA